MSVRQLLTAILLLCAAAPVYAANWYLDVGQARVTTDSFSIDSPEFIGITSAPSFKRDLTVVSAGTTRGIGPASFSVGILWSDTDSFQHEYALAEMLPAVVIVDHRVSVFGARAAWTPQLPLGNGWEVDGAVGLLYLHRRITTGQLLAGTETQDDFMPYVGAGISRWFTRNVGVRAGVELSNDYEAVSVGLRIAF